MKDHYMSNKWTGKKPLEGGINSGTGSWNSFCKFSIVFTKTFDIWKFILPFSILSDGVDISFYVL